MKALISILLLTQINIVFGQSLDCQLMRDEIMTQSRNQQQLQQQRQMQQQQQALALAQMDPMQRAQAQIYMGGQQLGSALSNMGQPSLEQKIQIYKQRCE